MPLFQTLSRGLCAAALLSAAGLSQAADYRLTDLGTLPGGDLSRAIAINQAGVVVGDSSREPGTYAMRPTRFGQRRDSDLLRHSGLHEAQGSATAVNDAGDIAGTVNAPDLGWRPFVVREGVLTLLQPPGSDYAGVAGMNNAGDLVGFGRVRPNWLGGFLWHAGTWTALRGPVHRQQTSALAINDAGLVVGWADLRVGADGKRVGFLWQNGVAVGRLPSLGGPWTEAHGVNQAGTVVGLSTLAGRYDRHAFVYRDGQMQDIDGDPLSISEAEAINAQGEVVGWRTAQGRWGAFVYRQGQMQWVDDLLPPAQRAEWTVDLAHGINDAGQIVGEAVHLTLGRRAVLLTPTAVR